MLHLLEQKCTTCQHTIQQVQQPHEKYTLFLIFTSLRYFIIAQFSSLVRKYGNVLTIVNSLSNIHEHIRHD
jgi:hypothetical protein